MKLPVSIVWFFFCMIALLPISLFASNIVAIGAGDNVNYINAFHGIGTMNFSQAFFQFRLGSGGFEPVSFLYFYFLARIDFSYEEVIFYKMLLFNVSLSALLVTLFRKNLAWLFFITLFFSISQYTLALHAELHHLAIALIFANLSFIAWVKNKKYGSYTFLLFSALSHAQIFLFLLAAWRYVLTRVWILASAVVIFSILTVLLYPQVASKVSFYRQNPVGGFTQTIVLWASLTAFTLIFLRQRFASFFFFSSCVAAFSILVGGGRLNILLILFFLGVVSHGIHEKYLSSVGRLTFGGFLLIFMSYDLYRSVNFYNELINESSW